MEQRFSEMTPFELTQKIGAFTDQARKSEQLGMVSELAVYERKIDMARAYLMDPEDFKSGQTYFVRDLAFKIHHMKGILAWGGFEGSEKLYAYPISLLKKKK
ncbi:YfhH family protein [Sporolactobacillus pectinivorans]|uniref:YfhH family protein n=1 Tax=Sporolactobacillus pectinivorans TaxID=1591408 RepID=UPI000C266B26|nr:YfhH family protein [Sporolactobacillus pectinivorans]